MSSLYEIFEKVLNMRGLTTADVSKATGINQSTFSNWKHRNNMITGENAIKIAKYLHISIDYLMTGEELNLTYNAEISDFEYRIILAYRKADDYDQTSVLRTLGIKKDADCTSSKIG